MKRYTLLVALLNGALAARDKCPYTNGEISDACPTNSSAVPEDDSDCECVCDNGLTNASCGADQTWNDAPMCECTDNAPVCDVATDCAAWLAMDGVTATDADFKSVLNE